MVVRRDIYSKHNLIKFAFKISSGKYLEQAQ